MTYPNQNESESPDNTTPCRIRALPSHRNLFASGVPLGIFGISWLSVRLGIAEKPGSLEFRDLFALSVLGGIGFTVSLLVADLALVGIGDGSEAETAKAAVLVTSLAASLIGSALLLRRGRVHAARL